MADFGVSPVDNVDCNIVNYESGNSRRSARRDVNPQLQKDGPERDVRGAESFIISTPPVCKNLSVDRGKELNVDRVKELNVDRGKELSVDRGKEFIVDRGATAESFTSCLCDQLISGTDSSVGKDCCPEQKCCRIDTSTLEDLWIEEGEYHETGNNSEERRQSISERMAEFDRAEMAQVKIVEAMGIKILQPGVLKSYKFLAAGTHSIIRTLYRKNWEGHCAKVFFVDRNSDDPDVAFHRMLSEAISLKLLLKSPGGVPRLAGVILRPYAIVMTQHGDSLSTWVRKGNPPPFCLVIVLLKAAIILHGVHDIGFIHCDIKSGNICVRVSDDGTIEVTIIDWGLMTQSGSTLWPERRLNGRGAMVALEEERKKYHPHIAPSLYNGWPADSATDTFALALLVQHLKDKKIKTFENEGLSKLVSEYLASEGDTCCLNGLIRELQSEVRLRNENYFLRYRDQLTKRITLDPHIYIHE